MPKIELLTQATIDKIAAGEVIDRPSSIVKELVENAIDAKANAITIEIKEGGISFIRITDNGCGIAREQVPLAFLRHSTSKIRSVDDLLSVSSLGFRGEALSSISAVARVELITKSSDEFIGTRYVIEGSKELSNEEVGAPDGTTFLIRDLFFNTPARRKFLKSAQTEGSYIRDIVEKLALSHPDVSFVFIQNNQTKLQTSGNGNVKDLIYHIYGREISSSLIEVDVKNEWFQVKGFIGKPVITRGNRNYENYYVNQRYVKSSLLSKAIEEGYRNYMMLHQYPFTILYFEFAGDDLDVNVHPSKMELRFEKNQEVFEALSALIKEALSQKELIPEVPLAEEKEETQKVIEKKPEPFEKNRMEMIRKSISKTTPYEIKYPAYSNRVAEKMQEYEEPVKLPEIKHVVQKVVQPSFLAEEAKEKHKIIGQLFKTYWLVEYEDKLYIVDQHAAHEKVLFERNMEKLKKKEFTSQMLCPPIVLHLDAKEVDVLEKYKDDFCEIGYEIENFGGNDYTITAVPDNLYHLDMKELFLEILDSIYEDSKPITSETIHLKVATMSCKAAIKGNQSITLMEMQALLDELFTLENPYHCPHGRPTIITMSKYELEKKFKRII